MTVRTVLAVREFRALLASSLLSVLGDQVARIAVALLVFDRTGSPFAAAATYACSLLPWLVAGPVLAALADRLPRRRLMVVSDLVRAALVGVLLLPSVPLPLLFVVLLLVGLVSPAFDAAKSAVLTDVLPGESYLVGNALQNVTLQFAQVAGFLVGGAAVALTSTSGALALDAATFLVSAGLLGTWVRERPLPEREAVSLLGDTVAGVRWVARNPVLRRMLGFGLLSALVTIAPEGLAVPVAAQLGGGPVTAGLLTAALPAGFLIGSIVVLRVPAERRQNLLPLLVLVSGVALLPTPALRTPVAVTVLWLLVGAGSALGLIANATYMQAVPREMRGRAYGVADTALTAVQGALLLALGGLAEVLDPRVVVAGAGGAALLLLLLLLRSPERSDHPASSPTVDSPARRAGQVGDATHGRAGATLAGTVGLPVPRAGQPAGPASPAASPVEPDLRR